MAKHSGITTDNTTLRQRHGKLEEILNGFRKVIVAYSGGVDSTLLLRVCLDCLGQGNVIACLAESELLARSEYESAIETAEKMGAVLEIVHPGVIEKPEFAANPADRCYHCKMELYLLLTELARLRGCDVVLCGSNADDSEDFRPGLRAEQESGIRSPLCDAGLTKDDIRALSKEFALPNRDKPPQPCLATRIVYDLEITTERLKQIEQGEKFLYGLGFKELRVRHHGNLARIEVPADRIADLAHPEHCNEIVTYFKGLGFTYVSLDLQGFRSGSANEALK
ncbi:MAG: ATP-dependent sacrificial sulfur transferase LarE [Sedimentisphaerales bacterium]|nr:ATP-dependent sacrificial sulfur transferase LarE [Sedimentisphaerales bacterium]